MAAHSDVVQLVIPPSEGRALAWLHQHGEILSETTDPETGAVTGRFRLPNSIAGQFRAKFPSLADAIPAPPEPE